MDEFSKKESLQILKKFALEADNWEEISTPQDGIYFVKMPNNDQSNQTLFQIKIKKNPNSTKEKGIYIKNRKELFLFRDLINDKNIESLLEEIYNNNELQETILNLDRWKGIDCGIVGISYVKMPNPDTVALGLNPVNGNGKKIKKRDIFLKNFNDLEIYRERFNNSRLENAIEILEEINKEWKYHLDISKEKGKDRFFNNNKDFFNDEDN
jgi:hypothetical protein